MKLKIIEVENREVEKIVVYNDELIKKAYFLGDSYDRYITKEQAEEFEKKFGYSLKDTLKKGGELYKIRENPEKAEELEEWLEHLDFLPTYNGILLKEEFDEIVENEDVLYLYDNANDLIFDKKETYYDFEDYYEYERDNYRKIEKINEIEVEKIEDEWNENDKTYHYNYYKIKDTNIYFRVYISHYQGIDPSLDEDWEETDWEEFYKVIKD